MHSASLRKTILRERDDARRNESLRPAFLAYRLNRQVDVYNDVLVKADDWRAVERRPVPPREGNAIVGIDLGSERSWSGAWCLWSNGRSECYAVCPGIPDLAERERQDAMPRGLYQRLRDDGVLLVDEGLRVSRPSTLIDYLVGEKDIAIETMLSDRFHLGAMQDAVAGRWPVVPRVVRWSEATEDISAFRRLVADGPLSIVPECRSLARVALSQASVASDDQGVRPADQEASWTIPRRRCGGGNPRRRVAGQVDVEEITETMALPGDGSVSCPSSLPIRFGSPVIEGLVIPPDGVSNAVLMISLGGLVVVAHRDRVLRPSMVVDVELRSMPFGDGLSRRDLCFVNRFLAQSCQGHSGPPWPTTL